MMMIHAEATSTTCRNDLFGEAILSLTAGQLSMRIAGGGPSDF
ncbi:MAG: hypothetical protein ACOYNR_13525 [Blastocatellia bacterium]